MSLRFVPNPGTILLKASSLWVTYGVIITDVTIKIIEYINEHREFKWQDMVLPIVLLLIPLFRVIQQQSVATATERKLAEENLVRLRMQQEAMSSTPPLTEEQVKVITEDAKDTVKGLIP